MSATFASKGRVPREGACLWCGRTIVVNSDHDDGDRSYLNRGYFCTATCGWRFGVRMAELGHRLHTSATRQTPGGSSE